MFGHVAAKFSGGWVGSSRLSSFKCCFTCSSGRFPRFSTAIPVMIVLTKNSLRVTDVFLGWIHYTNLQPAGLLIMIINNLNLNIVNDTLLVEIIIIITSEKIYSQI